MRVREMRFSKWFYILFALDSDVRIPANYEHMFNLGPLFASLICSVSVV